MELCSLFADMSHQNLEKILHLVSEVSVPEGGELITQDTFGDCFYVLIDGLALAYLKTDNDEEISLANLSKFFDMSEIMTVQAGVEGLIKQIVTMASKVMGADRASLFIMDNYKAELWSKVAEGLENRPRLQ